MEVRNYVFVLILLQLDETLRLATPDGPDSLSPKVLILLQPDETLRHLVSGMVLSASGRS